MSRISEKNRNRIFKYYTKVVVNLSSEIIDSIAELDDGIPPSLGSIHDSMSNLANKYSDKFLELNREQMGENEFEMLDNLIRVHLLDLSAKTDYIPDEEFISECGRELSTLVYFTKKVINNERD